MGKVLVTERHLQDIASAIRGKLGSQDTWRPGDMAAAIGEISGYPEPEGTVTIAQNGVLNVKDYAQAAVNVQPVLQQKTATQNGTVTPDSGYDGLSNVVVHVSGGESDPFANLNDYIEATGTQWINTGFQPTRSTRVECVANLVKRSTGSEYMVLYGTEGNSAYYFGMFTENKGRACIGG